MADYTPLALSASANGKLILIAATSSPGTTLHTAVSGTSDWDEILLWMYNSHTLDQTVVIQWGGTTSPDDHFTYIIRPYMALVHTVPGFRLQNGLLVKAYSTTANKVVVAGNVDRYTA